MSSENKVSHFSLILTWRWLLRWRPSGVDLGHPADASRNRRPYPRVHSGRGRDQSNPVGRDATGLDRDLLQQSLGDSPGLMRPPHSLLSILPFQCSCYCFRDLVCRVVYRLSYILEFIVYIIEVIYNWLLFIEKEG